MKRILLTAAFLGTVAAGGLVAAQAPAPTAAAAADHAAHHPAPAKAAAPAPAGKTAGPAPTAAGAKAADAPAHGEGMMCDHMMGGGAMGGGMMGGGAMGGGMMGHMMGGMGAMMGGPGTKVDVKKTDKGVTITLTAPDAAGATRLQKMAEAMRLMHEAMAQ
ncbi:MAG TPA: hypothetical protein VIU64_08685 [Polyangia bacterium]